MSLIRSRDEALRRRALDAVFDAYLDWREESEAVQATYHRWTSRHACHAACAFDAYARALEREGHAAEAYADVMRRVAPLVEPDWAEQVGQLGA